MKKRCLSLILAVLLLWASLPGALAYQPTTLHSGMRSTEVARMQQALISLGYLGGTADGIFGTHTEKAVIKFQKAHHLTADGLAGTKTLNLLYSVQSGSSAQTAASPAPASTPAPSASAPPQPTAAPAPAAVDSGRSVSGNLFSGDYATLRSGSSGTRVRVLQQALNSLGYSCGSADGKFGKKTLNAVLSFQKAKGLAADGLAGRKTLTALEKAMSGRSSGNTSSTSTSSSVTVPDTPAVSDDGLNPRMALPSVSSVRLLHWYNDVKPSLKSGQHILILDPASGLCWTLRLLSLGRHADSEPLTARDTATMVKAFGGVNTWNQKAVYVRLPNGTWTVGSTHDMPHLSGSVSDNNFNGHLCVHFLRNMSECEVADPKYGVANQNTIRDFWKSLTGETIDY